MCYCLLDYIITGKDNKKGNIITIPCNKIMQVKKL